MADQSVQIIRQGEYEGLYGDPLQVTINPTYRCNYNCSYCGGAPTFSAFPHHQSYPVDYWKRIIDSLENLGKDSYEIELCGGEPTLYGQLEELAKYLDFRLGDRLSDVNLITNGSALESVYARLTDSLTRVRLSMLITYHHEFADFDRLVGLIKKISGRADIMFTLMYHPEARELIKNFFYRLIELRADYPFIPSVSMIRNPHNFGLLDQRYSPEDIEWAHEANMHIARQAHESSLTQMGPSKKIQSTYFRDVLRDGQRTLEQDHGNYIITELRQGRRNFKGLWCAQGARYLRFDPMGTVYGSFGGCGCNISQPGDNLNLVGFPYLFKCPVETCNCGCGVRLPKFRDRTEGEHYIRCAKDRTRLKAARLGRINLRENLDHLLAKHGRLAFWGLGCKSACKNDPL